MSTKSKHRAGAGMNRIQGSRPPFAVAPGPREESVWDYPRPPVVVRDPREIVVRAGGVEIARTRSAFRVLETASPPTFYLPLADVHREHLEPAGGRSYCEWKGEARYWHVVAGGARIERAAWSYPDPLPPYKEIQWHLAFYAALLDCQVDGVRVVPQPGRFYGGWITPEVVGPFKGEPGTEGW
jgi:uncharacterized protein (DUF427 family)